MQQMTEPTAPRRDPAPSRIAYRVQRLWLTPLFRQVMRIGLPMCSAMFFTILILREPETQQMILGKIDEVRRSVAERPEFMVKLMAVDGASEELGEEVRQVLPVDFPVSSFDLDLDRMKAEVEEIDAIARVDLRIRSGGILQLDVTERLPAVVWRHQGALELLDSSGQRVASVAHRTARPDLPLMVGEGAGAAVAEALKLIAAVGPLAPRLRGLVRMGDRRWDIALDRDQRILLPETGAVAALEQVIALDQAQDLLARDISAVDMRSPHRPTLRMAPQALEELRRIKAIESGELD